MCRFSKGGYRNTGYYNELVYSLGVGQPELRFVQNPPQPTHIDRLINPAASNAFNMAG